MPSTRTVLLVVAHSRSDRWPTTELYKRHFLGVLHMVSGKGCGKATAGVLCMHVASSPHYLYHDNVAKILAALARARAVSRGAHDMSKSRAAASSGQAGAPPPRPPLPSWASALREAVGDARMRLASGVLVGHMDFWLRPPSFGRGLRREMPWRLPRGLMPKHEPTSIRLLRSLNVSGDGGAPRTLERGAVVRYRTARGLAFHRYGPKASIPILSISNATEVELAGGGTAGGRGRPPGWRTALDAPAGWLQGHSGRSYALRRASSRSLEAYRGLRSAPAPAPQTSLAPSSTPRAGGTLVGETLAPPGALPPALGARHSQRHHADFVLHDYFFGGCFGAERLRARRRATPRTRTRTRTRACPPRTRPARRLMFRATPLVRGAARRARSSQAPNTRGSGALAPRPPAPPPPPT